MSEQWGPWIEHVPGPCPVSLGMWIQATVRFKYGREETNEGRVNEAVCNPCWWLSDGQGEFAAVARYRIRRPRALTQLIELVETMPAQPQEVGV